jgi:hypothetical protein
MELTTGAAGEWDPILDGDGDYGTIAFASHTVASKADFIRLTQKDEQKLANIHKTFEEQEAMPTSFPLMKYIMTQWFNDPPKLLLRIVGSMEGPGLPAMDESMISIVDTVMDDAFSAATAAQGWVLTCGNEHDMSGIVGHAFDRLRSSTNAPLVGVNAWSTIERREQILRDARGKPLKGKGVRRTCE